jgi:hypothetical protein
MPSALARKAHVQETEPLMPKRVVDGDALWSSDKLNQIEPPSNCAEYANLEFNRGCCCGCG